MTEDEAKTKWCPFARVIMDWSTIEGRQPIVGPFNRDHAINSDLLSDVIHRSRCLGSACMAWRWDMEWSSATEEGQGGDLVLRLKPLKGKPRLGYCGLAGRP